MPLHSTEYWPRIIVTIGALALLTAACSESDLAPLPDDALALGTWGGDDVAVMVTDAGAHVHIGCTFGDIQGTIPLDEDGRFTIDGTYVLRAYPVAVGPTLPAQFSGQVKDETLTFAVAVNDTVESKVVALGPVSVVFGQEPKMGQCPICQVTGLPQTETPRKAPFWRFW